MPQGKLKKSLLPKNDEFLSENREGIYIPVQHAKMIWQGNKKLIVKGEKVENKLGKLFYLIGGNNCYGVLKLKDVFPLSLEEFKARESEHRITDEERQLWWPGKQKLFAYDFGGSLIAGFENPKLVKTSKDSFVNSISFLSELQARHEFLINNMSTYDPKDFSNDDIENDLKVSFAIYEGKKAGKEYSQSFDDLERIVKSCVEELNSRGITFDSKCLKEESNKLYQKVSESIAGSKGRQTVQLLTGFVPCKSSKKFSNEEELVEYLFGGD